MIQIAHIFHSLEGRWALHRSIPGYGKMQGIAKFQKGKEENHVLHYREEGSFQYDNGKDSHAFREYVYRFQNEKISVFFKEIPERLMHILEFSNPPLNTATASHLCKCDTYDATYTFNFPDEFQLDYIIKGPNKDYRINTVFKRILS